MPSSPEFEFVKLIAQGITALFVAWLTVRLALRRYKSEKMWERRISLCADALRAMEDVKRVYDTWVDEEERGRKFSIEYQDELRDRYWSARKELERISMLGRLQLPEDISSVLVRCLQELDTRQPSPHEQFYYGAAVLSRAVEELIARGKSSFGNH